MSKVYLENNSAKIKKVLKYVYMYGLSRTHIKVKGHYHMEKEYDHEPKRIDLSSDHSNKRVGIIGCGNHAYTDIAYFLRKNRGDIIAASMDIDKNKAISLFEEYNAYNYTTDPEEIFNDEQIDLVYVVSNHATHTPYAVEALKHGKDVFVEKPIAVNMEQYVELVSTVRQSNQQIYAGYNRPFSPAVGMIKSYLTDSPITLNCFIMGHKLPSDHWYRNPNEGSRIVGNLGHWLDLAIHLLMGRTTLPKQFELTLITANPKHKDDDFVLTLKSDLDDLVVLTFSTRSDPFEGVMENISFQNEKIIAHVEDFRKLTIWEESKKITKSFIPKDAGHEKSVLQPFDEEKRDWRELEWSTFVMLKVEEMLQNGVKDLTINIEEEIEKLIK